MSEIELSNLDWRPIRVSEGTLWVKVTPQQWEQYLSISPYKCEHPKSELRAKAVQKGSIQWREQCLTCGRSTSNALKRDPSRVVPDWDEALEESYSASIEASREEFETAFIEQTLSIEAGESFEYQEYLKSEAWQKKRLLVLDRDKHRCQGCLSAEASEVHHLNYDDVPREMMFDLVALCRTCHERVHRRKVARLRKLKEAEENSVRK